MTNEQAIAELQKEHDLIQGERDLDGSQFAPALLEALAMAIEALNHSEIPNGSGKDTNVPSTDTISRQDAIDVAREELESGTYYDIPSKIESLPSAQPERKTGHWIPYDQRFPWSNDYKCSECGNYLNFSGVNGGRGDANFCPSCGADMRGEQDE